LDVQDIVADIDNAAQGTKNRESSEGVDDRLGIRPALGEHNPGKQQNVLGPLLGAKASKERLKHLPALVEQSVGEPHAHQARFLVQFHNEGIHIGEQNLASRGAEEVEDEMIVADALAGLDHATKALAALRIHDV